MEDTQYDHKAIEHKWQTYWRENALYRTGERTADTKKEYVLVEWPYPSGNLHVGHWYAFAIPDIYVRAKRMQGHQVLFPMGFDAFGLPAENAAIKHNVSPREWTEQNIAHMREQLESMGNAFSWDKTTSSTDTSYYKWTQWMFTQFFEKDIAYRGTGIVNWCPSCHTVLANEQVVNEVCERCDTEVEKREMDEWKMRITQYADRLIDDLDALEWPESIKDAQRNWIGRSEGANISFELVAYSEQKSSEATSYKLQASIDVFTTRPDTIFGATYLVLSPEHQQVANLKKQAANSDEIEENIKKAGKKAEKDRLDATKEKTGVKLEGITAINPANNEEIPVFIADYVLAGYGTGAIMAVPAHDERDYAFAQKFNIETRRVIDTPESEMPFVGNGALINSGQFNGLSTEEAREKITAFVGGETAKTYKLRDWSVGRQRYWGVPIPIVYDPEGNPHAVPEEHLPWELPTDVDFTPTGEPPLAKSQELKERTERIFGAGWTPEVETMDTFVDSSWYFLRYIDNENADVFSSKDAQDDWMPIDLYFGGAEHTTMHLLYSRFWQKALFDLDLTTVSEPYTRRINRGLVLGPDGNKMSKSKGNVIDPDAEVEKFGADTVKMYLAFLGPYGEVSNYPWSMSGVTGIRRFLEKVWRLAERVSADAEALSPETEHVLHKTISKVTNDIAQFKFNTAVSQLMVCATALSEHAHIPRDAFNTYLRILAPFAPHITEELWESGGNTPSIHTTQWPEVDAAKLVSDTVAIAIQINGKVRTTVTVAADAEEEAVLAAIPEHIFEKWVGDSARITRKIYVPGRLLSLAVANT